ncbi:hypothetical protein [Nonomuraea dietziae]|uniref:hypothetical protein n=1 Tax=Nonomuraea dietziae TaxID=65515 RepID=UPI00340B997E
MGDSPAWGITPTGEDCYTLKIAATTMRHLERLVDELAQFGSTTSIVYNQTLPYRGPQRVTPA